MVAAAAARDRDLSSLSGAFNPGILLQGTCCRRALLAGAGGGLALAGGLLAAGGAVAMAAAAADPNALVRQGMNKFRKVRLLPVTTG